MQIGARNAEATMDALNAARISVRGKDTGGSSGRSIEVHVANGDVLVRGVGQQARKL
jgi:chemotaxis receptor (MCP) glutamine deamidase CheD